MFSAGEGLKVVDTVHFIKYSVYCEINYILLFEVLSPFRDFSLCDSASTASFQIQAESSLAINRYWGAFSMSPQFKNKEKNRLVRKFLQKKTNGALVAILSLQFASRSS
jgi:hypothetical protein